MIDEGEKIVLKKDSTLIILKQDIALFFIDFVLLPSQRLKLEIRSKCGARIWKWKKK